jgi:amino acid adenylation domain-containing protein
MQADHMNTADGAQPMEALVAGVQEDLAALLHRPCERIDLQATLAALGAPVSVAVQALRTAEKRLGLCLEALPDLHPHTQVSSVVDALQRAARPRVPRRQAASEAQKTAWFLHRLSPSDRLAQECLAVRVRGAVDADQLERALWLVTRRHPALHVVFSPSGAELVEEEAAPALAVGPERLERPGLDPAGRDQEARRLIGQAAGRHWDPLRAPPFMTALARFAADDHLVIIAGHHLVLDAASARLLLALVWAVYRDLVEGSPVVHAAPRPVVAPPASPEAAAYWKSQLHGAPAILDLPTSHPRPGTPGAAKAQVPVALSPEHGAQLASLAARLGITLEAAALGCWTALLSRYAGEPDVLVGLRERRLPEDAAEAVGGHTSLLVLRQQVDKKAPAQVLLTRVQARLTEARAHRQVAFEALLGALQQEDGNRVQLQSSFQWSPPVPVPGGLFAERVPAGNNAPEPLSLELWGAQDGSLGGTLTYAAEVFDAGYAARVAEHFARVVEGVCADPAAAVGQLPLLPQAERTRLVNEWAAGPVRSEPPSAAHRLFEAQAARTPEAVAVIFGEQRLTYAQLEGRANQLANLLLDRGLRPEDRVALVLRPGVEGIVALYGVLKAGGAYVPLDPDAPPQRLAFCVRETGARFLLTQEPSALAAELEDTCVLPFDSRFALLEGTRATLPAVDVPADALAYIIYTSGSTGEPKGVAVQHASLVNHNRAVVTDFQLVPQDRVLQFTPLNFDAAGEEIYPPLMCGASIVVRGELVPTHEFNALIERDGLTVLSLPPAFVHEWVNELARRQERLPRCLRRVLLGGEKLLPETLRTWHAVGGDSIPWINVYGPTEGTITSASCPISPGDALLATPVLPIGRPVANGRIYLLDGRLEPVPTGHPGELFIGGAGLARGYWCRPEETGSRFVPDPFSPAPGGRMYRTGDVARFLEDGRLEFVGRADHQVKIRGFRVEPGEIEATLRKHPAVQEAVVLARTDAGPPRLVAYVVLHSAGSVEGRALKRHVRELLPEYMVPAAVVLCDALPLTPNGKVDRKALPAPVEEAREGPAGVLGSETEERLAALWREVLGVREVGGEDNFFELGGQSLSAMQLASRILEAFHVELEVMDVFETPLLREMAQRIADRQGTAEAAPQVESLSDSQVDALLEELLARRD